MAEARMHGFVFRRLVSPQFTHYAESPPRRLEIQSELRQPLIDALGRFRCVGLLRAHWPSLHDLGDLQAKLLLTAASGRTLAIKLVPPFVVG